MLTITSTPTSPPVLQRPSQVRLVSAAPSLWRVIDGNGRVIGHLQVLSIGSERRFRARRFHAATRAFRDLGDFWSADDAVDCLRFTR
ncbi:hypothetical protein [Microbacterium ulmi]|uniref:DNA mismatch repair protein n=1 Tax=Microbacterium ulmi TaxID=179095 RepID=A0A7Y2PYP9_9MICO|nr:hypothetical protein [Microbacterium ulmi]NII71176.1 hypothetical protein [Microbacterium ulmi]NNH02483.1 hypothetical protein [Microbacterium ulmi]